MAGKDNYIQIEVCLNFKTKHCGKNYNKKIKIGTVGGVMHPNLKEKCKILVWM